MDLSKMTLERFHQQLFLSLQHLNHEAYLQEEEPDGDVLKLNAIIFDLLNNPEKHQALLANPIWQCLNRYQNTGEHISELIDWYVYCYKKQTP